MLFDSSASPALTDRVKVALLVRMRKSHLKTLERSSVSTFRKRRVPTYPAIRLVAAARKYKRMGWLPTSLLAPAEVPKEARLPARYLIPYYGTGKVGWSLYGRRPIDPELKWDTSNKWNRAFDDRFLERSNPTTDESFTRLRVQGPNPFMLKKAAPDASRGDASQDVVFDLDFSRLFAGVVDPVIARFRVVGDGLAPSWISIGRVLHRPGDQSWDDAKRVVNGLDARYSAFIRHLLNTHLMVAQAYAIAAYSLPVWHPLRPFMNFFTYGSLHVNDMAYGALLTKNSYFIRSNFVSTEDARRLIENSMDEFDFDEWIVPRDLAKRGIADIPNHPYVEDATLVWPAIERIVERHLDDLDISDADVGEDPNIGAWYARLREVLPGTESIPKLSSRQALEDLMTALIYNNVIHEVCGNLSPILCSTDPLDRAVINIDSLRCLADPSAATPEPAAADVFLMDQASFVSTFNVAGNNLLTINAARFIDDPRLRDAVEELQETLRAFDETIGRRNAERKVPFNGMAPSKWEASISF